MAQDGDEGSRRKGRMERRVDDGLATDALLSRLVSISPFARSLRRLSPRLLAPPQLLPQVAMAHTPPAAVDVSEIRE